MLYALRDNTGAVVALSEEQLNDQWQQVDSKDPALKAFIEKRVEFGKLVMQASDLEFIRVLEDLIELMIEKNMISFTDFPKAAQEKLLTRRGYREKMRSKDNVSLIGQEEDLL